MADNSQIVFDRVDSMECGACHAKIDVSSLPTFSRAVCPSCGAEITVPGRLGNYLLLTCLGSGGMGSVYRAYDETLARTVAIKVMLKSLGDAPEFLESFRREAQAAAKLNHPNIAQIYSFGQEKGQPYIVMELVGGKHFDEMIAQSDPLDQALVMKIGMDIADGLQLAAASNLIHGDIKPENILLDERDTAKLLDFGIASSPNAQTTEIWGTPYYIAPEKLKRQRVDFRSDIYCLGGTLYHALTQHPPFEGKDAIEVVKARLEHPPVPMKEYRPDIDPEVAEIIDRMLQVEPAMRYPTYGSLLSDMRKYLSRVHPQSASSVGSSNKRIVIKGRGKGAGSRPAEQASPAGGKHHIAVSRGTVDASTTSRHASQHIQPLDGMPSAPKTLLGADDEKQSGSKSSKGVWIAVVAVLVLLGIAGGVFFHMTNSRRKALNASFHAQVERRDATVNKIRKIVDDAAKLRDSTLAGYVKEADNIVSQAVAMVEADPEFGTQFTERIRYIAPEPVAEKEPVADTPEGEKAEGEKDAAEKDAKAEGEAAPAAEEGAGAESSAENTADTSGADVAAEQPAVEDAVEELALEGMPLKAREIFELLAPVRTAEKTANALGEKAEAFVKNAEETIAKVSSALPESSKDVEDATSSLSKNADEIGEILTQASSAYEEATASLGSLQDTIRKAKVKLGELSAEAERRASDRKRQEAEAEKARQEQAAEAARLAELERVTQEKQAELNKILAAAAANLENVRAFKFDAAIRDIKRLDEQLKYPESKKALEIALKRIECMKDLKAFLVERLQAVPFTLPGGAWKVKSVSDRIVEIEFRGGKVDSMTWDKLKLQQMVPLISFYLEDDDNVKQLKLRQHVDQLRNAAVYYMTLAPENQGARKKATEYVQTMLTKLPSRKSEILSLLPELKLEDQE